MQDVKDIMFSQILDEFAANGDREAAIERMRMLSVMHNQKVIGVVKKTTEDHPLGEGRVMISSMDNQKGLYEEGRISNDFWQDVGLAYAGPEQPLPKDIVYMGDGILVNCSDDLIFGYHEHPEKPTVTFGGEDNEEFLTLAFDSQENLDQVITALTYLSSRMEPQCSSSTDA